MIQFHPQGSKCPVSKMFPHQISGLSHVSSLHNFLDFITLGVAYELQGGWDGEGM
jgi:hypothetical protein